MDEWTKIHRSCIVVQTKIDCALTTSTGHIHTNTPILFVRPVTMNDWSVYVALEDEAPHEQHDGPTLSPTRTQQQPWHPVRQRTFACCCCCGCRLSACGCRCCALAWLSSIFGTLLVLYMVWTMMLHNIEHGSSPPPAPPRPTPLAIHNCSAYDAVTHRVLANIGVTFLGTRSFGVCWPRHDDDNNNNVVPFSQAAFQITLESLDHVAPPGSPRMTVLATDLQAATSAWFNVTSTAANGLVPGLSYTLQRRPMEPDQNTDIANTMNITLAAAAYCGNMHDVTKLLPISHTAWSHIMSSSIVGCLGSLFDPACIAAALQAKLGTTPPCTLCWRALAMCSLDQCGDVCAFHPTGTACERCTLSVCLPPTQTCTGLPGWLFPADTRGLA